jgi:transcriptional regulator with XRE-family HTH domain
MGGDTLKSLREAKCWSQAHLAQAAGLNIRTVQRIEAGEPASHETMLSLAAALGVDVAKLEVELPSRSRPPQLGPLRLSVAALAVTPAAVFIAVNVLRSFVGVAAPYDFLASAGGRLMRFETFNLASPIIFLGGAAAALLICLPTLVRVHAKAERGSLLLSGIELRARTIPLLLCAAAVLSAGILIAYAALEQLRTPLS